MQKKLIILGGNPETGVLVDTAESMGVYTIVIDPNPNAPAKKSASETYDIDGFDIDKIVSIAKERKVDGVLVGVADILVKSYWEICEKLDFPCYATEKAVEAFCSKDGFKRACLQFDIQDIPGIYLDRESDITKPNIIDYPLMIKPVDSGGGVGMSICRNDSDYEESVKTALNFSKKGVVLVEKYMDCDDMAVYYTFKDGIPYLSATYDRITTKDQGDVSPVCIGAVYPSKHTEQFENYVHPKLCSFFDGLGLKNGILNMQFFVEKNKFYAYDPGFRLQGEAPHIHLAHINGFDHRKMLVNFALTGTFGEADFSQKNDPRFKGKSACTIWVLLTDGKIGSIKGLDDLKSDKKIAYVLDRFKTGDVVTPDMLGTERQVFARIYIEGNSTSELSQKIDEIKHNLIIHDDEGKDMILYWVDPSIINN
ncbi:carbamoyl-phosphate-synthetase [Maribacter sp. HTCC2170]|uniref:ATP-binding protein n=1 Tax=Maribacter sp. (strain HTCC2170 / KCCM 42371) TaxID=313603 RepID=UPI00006B4958|nr:carbamoyl-phosphate-synthetase [Maribacter sp. HTCC2170]EAR01112.1 CarB family protein [Maribacter sp. HTCC2170]